MALAHPIGPKREWLRAWAATPVPQWTPLTRIPLPHDLRLLHYWDSATLRPTLLRLGRRVLTVETATPPWPPVLSVRVPGVRESDVLMLLDPEH